MNNGLKYQLKFTPEMPSAMKRSLWKFKKPSGVLFE